VTRSRVCAPALVRLGAAAVAAFTLSALAAPAQTLTDGRFAVDTVASLPPYTPVGIAFAPDGRIFFWQKSGVVRIVKNGALLATPFADISDHVNNFHDRGLLGLALDPAFDANGYVYLFYVYEGGGNTADSGPKTGRLTRIQADPANPDHALLGETVILGSVGTPPCSIQPIGADCLGFDADTHTADTVRFADDGTLFLSIGDGAPFAQADPLALRAQSLDHYEGKILRIRPDGTAPSDNPFYDGSDSIRSRVYSFGLRNPFRFTLEPTSGEPVIGDVGWNQREEINFGKGKNFGWPCYEGELARPEYAALSPACAALPAAAVTFGAYTYDHAVLGSTAVGGPVYSASVYPTEYQGAYFFADYSADWIRYGRLDASGVLQNVQLFGSEMGGPVDLELGPDGSLYYVAFNTGQLRRIRFAQGSAPSAAASAKPDSGYSPLAVQFSSLGSSSPDGGPLSYRWDFGDGSSSTAANPSHTYNASGLRTFNAQLTATRQGVSASASVRVVVGSLPPTVSITQPASGLAVHPGDTVSFAGTASDPDEILPPSAFVWQVLLHHENHIHVEGTVGGTQGSFVVVDHGTGTYYYELVLTVKDSSGLATTQKVRTAIVTSQATYRINAGGSAYVDTLGQFWSADQGFNTGQAASTSDPIADPNAPLYQSERWDPPGAPELSYDLPVANGSYRVNLYFAEFYPGAAFVGGRVFDVSIEGTKILQNLDIFAEVGFEKPLVKSFTTTVSDGVLNILFSHVVENPKISAIEVIRLSTAPPPTPPPAGIRVNAGGPAFTDSSGTAWEADRNFNTGNAFTSAQPWTGPNAPLYGTTRWDPAGAPEMSYSFPVTPGTYTVTLHFAEIYFTAVGSRVFDVYIDGTKVLDKLDIVQEVGPMAPLVKSFTVNQTGSSLTISFVHQVENPTISGIEILPSSLPPPPPAPAEIRVNAGGPAFTDASGTAWEADRNFNTGNAFTSAQPWTGPNAPLYGTERWDPPGAPEMSYSFPVTPGTYRVTLHFAEIYLTAVGSRVFDVYIDGTKVLDRLDIVQEVGPMAPLVKSFTVNQTGSSLTISFVHQVENPTVSGIEILRQ
jgi:glucose/arabinose dehydrogenase/PKD repeat protein